MNILLLLGWFLVFVGCFFILSGIIGMYRFLGFYAKIHAASVIDCCGIPVALVGFAMMQDSYISIFKIILIIILIIILNPVSTNAIGRASLLFKVDKQGRVK